MSGYEFLAWVAAAVLIFGVLFAGVVFVVVVRANNKAMKDFERRTGRKF